MNQEQIFFPPEWYPQSGVQLTFPHSNSDWNYMLEEVTACFVYMAREILKRSNLLIVCKDKEEVMRYLLPLPDTSFRLKLVEIESNDTWARDHAGISVWIGNRPTVYDFTFNGWGLKFSANADNQITRQMDHQGLFEPNVMVCNKQNFVLEGGSVESDGKGTILTTTACLLSANRNDTLSQGQIESYLKETFGATRVLWLSHGALQGDDTDSHIDTLARFCDEQTIAYVQCTDANDEHYAPLQAMEKELQSFVSYTGSPYRLIPLPLPRPIYEGEERLPATYANFLILNTAVLVPTYDQPELDEKALQALQKAFPDREIVGIPCVPLIKQHGSLHCVTMQYPKGFLSF